MGKKILITSFTFPPQHNGVSHVVEAHSTGLARLGHDVTVATSYDSIRESDIWAGVKIRQFSVRGNALLIRGGYNGDIQTYQDFVKSFNGDLMICHCWQIWSTDLAIKVFDRVRCPKVIVSHGVSARYLPRKTLKGFLVWLAWKPYLNTLPRMLSAFDHAVLLSNREDDKSFYDHKLMHRIGYMQHSIIPNGVCQESFVATQGQADEFRTRHGIDKNPMFLFVSNYERNKNQRMAIEVIAKTALPDVVLVLIGSEINDYARSLQTFAKQAMPSGQRIIFLEAQTIEDICAAYYAADLFVCTSKLEVQPLMILEAMAAGKPFVSTDVGCVSELPGGIIVRDSWQMVRVIRELMADAPRRHQLGQQGRTAVYQRFNWDKIVRQYDVLIGELCSGLGERPR